VLLSKSNICRYSYIQWYHSHAVIYNGLPVSLMDVTYIFFSSAMFFKSVSLVPITGLGIGIKGSMTKPAASAFRHLTTQGLVTDHSGTRLGPLIPEPDRFRHRPFFPVRYRADQDDRQSGIPACQKNEIQSERLRAENDILDTVRSSEIVLYELRIAAVRCKEIRDCWLAF
jgi:hypothetical protein